MKNFFGILLMAIGIVFCVVLIYGMAHTSQECTQYEDVKELKSRAVSRVSSYYDSYIYELENGDYYESNLLLNKGVSVCVSSVPVLK